MAGYFGGYFQTQGGGGGGGSTPVVSGGVVSGAASAETLVDGSFISAEIISGGTVACAVGFNQSGALITAMALVSGRMPAIGVVTANYLSGVPVTVYTEGRLFAASINLSGFPNQPVYVGSSGALVSISGVSNSGLSSSGCYNQIIGTVINASGIFVRVL